MRLKNILQMVAQPRLGSTVGFEFNQRTIDDIRTIVKDQKPNQIILLLQF
jgi:hypothetical protein